MVENCTCRYPKTHTSSVWHYWSIQVQTVNTIASAKFTVALGSDSIRELRRTCQSPSAGRRMIIIRINTRIIDGLARRQSLFTAVRRPHVHSLHGGRCKSRCLVLDSALNRTTPRTYIPPESTSYFVWNECASRYDRTALRYLGLVYARARQPGYFLLHCESKNKTPNFSHTSSNVNRFSKFFHWQTQW